MRNGLISRALPLAAMLAVGALTLPAAAAAAPGRALVGTFVVAPGSCAGSVSGSYFRMILPTGDAAGPYVSNGDSPCADQTYSPLLPGTDGGLTTGAHQPAPSPAFDGSGNGLASRITQPTPFFGVRFAASTEPVDPQTGTRAPAPEISVDASGQLSGTVPAFGAAWNGQHFNQGAPKPDGSVPGNTARLTGTYDSTSGAYTLTWRSQIQGGPFDNFTGVWHLEGTFRPAGSSTAAAPSAAASAAGPAAPTAGPGAPAGGEAVTADAASPGDAAPVADATAGAEATGAVELASEKVSTEVTTRGRGWQPPSWLVLAIAAAGMAGAVTLVYLSRTEGRAAS